MDVAMSEDEIWQLRHERPVSPRRLDISRFQPVADLFVEDFPFAGSTVQSVDCPNTSKSKIH
jgi:hypothetical protein